MSSIGPNSPSTAVNDSSGGGLAWTSPTSVFISDETRANVFLSSDWTVSQYLVVSGFGFDVPDGATIDGVLVEVEGRADNIGRAAFTHVQLANNGTLLGSADTTSSELTETDTYFSRGGSSNTFGASLTSAIVNSADFQVRVRYGYTLGSNNTTGYIDHVRVTVYYTEGAGDPPQTANPTSDITTTGWTPSSGSTLYEMLDDGASTNDSDYIDSPASPTTASPAEVKFGTVTDPLLSTDHKVRYRFGKDTTGGSQIDGRAYLYQGATLITDFGLKTNVDGLTTYTETLSGTDADAITDYSDLRIRFTANQTATNVVPTFVAAGTAAFTASNGATIQPALPSGWAVNDIHVLVVHRSDNTDITDHADYTRITPSSATENNTAGQRVELFWRRAQSGDTAPTITAGSGTTIRGAQIFGIRGVPTGVDPFDASTRSNNAASATVTGANIVTTQANTLGLFIGAYEDDPNISSNTGSWTMGARSSSTLGNDMAIFHGTRTFATATTYSSNTIVTDASGGTISPNVGIILAFKPTPTASRELRVVWAQLEVPAVSADAYDDTDTQTVAATETVDSLLATFTATDTQAIAATEDVITNTRTTDTTDTQAVAIDELVASTNVNTVTDEQVVVSDDSLVIAFAFDAEDTQTVSSTETFIDIQAVIETTDTHAVAADETVVDVVAALETTDTQTLAEVETVIDISAVSEATDTQAISTTETVDSLNQELSSTDTHELAASETTIDLISTTSTADTQELQAVESVNELTRADTITDTQAITADDMAALEIGLELFEVSDEGSIQASSEIAETSAGHLAVDTSVLDTTELITQAITHVSDDTGVLDESAIVLDVSANYDVDDTSVVQDSTAITLMGLVNVVDDNNVVQDEIASIDTYATVTDSQLLSILDISTLDITMQQKSATDTHQIAASDTSSLGTPANQTFNRADQYSVSVTETVRDRTVVVRPDLREVAATEAAYLLYTHTVTDSLAVGSTEQKIAQNVQTADSLQVDIMVDAAALFRNIQLFDSNVLHGEDTIDLDVVYNESLVLFHMLQKQVTNVGFSKIGRGW
jgi:hypothetical protein